MSITSMMSERVHVARCADVGDGTVSSREIKKRPYTKKEPIQ